MFSIWFNEINLPTKSLSHLSEEMSITTLIIKFLVAKCDNLIIITYKQRWVNNFYILDFELLFCISNEYNHTNYIHLRQCFFSNFFQKFSRIQLINWSTQNISISVFEINSDLKTSVAFLVSPLVISLIINCSSSNIRNHSKNIVSMTWLA